ncbi:aromatic aminobenezylarsenical efflux permease ArsG family transporter [Maribellus sp. YY47]|uniref:aromatic aminobenezylarsenical efflux permease ArsG family transporter n=1 Tax=Maribellus sp. YY47 TaxID=2929486 RepID=UPI0020011CBF|nr:aromatic aminobenezylarsenical efflux permease ArsG family transporter [Maribellus sp. YY47]MCK3684256.1 aromatic aminobenezylarsenical efflux permease ArsG family transporter [Maribellus sp. YY47]
MDGFLTGLLENSSFPVLTAFILGLMTAISPCPLATNITAVGFIGKDIENRNRVFYNGLIYTLGRAVAYTLLAFVLFLGADQFAVSGIFQRYGEKIIGPLLIVIGLFMLGVLKISLPGGGKIAERFEKKGVTGYWDVLLLGMLFAMAFCPYSGVLYFGMLIPLTISSASGLYLPVVFAIATGIPVILFAWLIAYAVSGVGGLYNRLKTFELWFRRVIALVFILVGIYYVFTVFF